MKTCGLVLLTLLVLTGLSDALTTTRKETKTRKNKISDSFKQLDLPESEIDPNVSPVQPPADEIVSEVVEAVSSPTVAENEVSEAVAEVAEPTSPSLTEETNPINEDDQNQLSKYCKCSDTHCDCCRNFALPIVPVRGPGCAKITYLGNQKMSVSIKYGDIVIATRTISGKRATPICVGLPGGFSKFCGRVYGLSKGKDDFKACLGLELRSDEEVEASLRVSCFKFGAKGLTVTEAEPLPEVPKDEEDDDDIFGFGTGGADDDYDEEDEEEDEDDDEGDDDAEDDDDTDTGNAPPDDADYGGFSLDGLFDDDDSEETASPAQQTRTELKEVAQSKDENGTPAEGQVDAENTDNATKPKPSPSKVKKNKKKKKKSGDSEFALDILNGILDLFN